MRAFLLLSLMAGVFAVPVETNNLAPSPTTTSLPTTPPSTSDERLDLLRHRGVDHNKVELAERQMWQHVADMLISAQLAEQSAWWAASATATQNSSAWIASYRSSTRANPTTWEDWIIRLEGKTPSPPTCPKSKRELEAELAMHAKHAKYAKRLMFPEDFWELIVAVNHWTAASHTATQSIKEWIASYRSSTSAAAPSSTTPTTTVTPTPAPTPTPTPEPCVPRSKSLHKFLSLFGKLKPPTCRK